MLKIKTNHAIIAAIGLLTIGIFCGATTASIPPREPYYDLADKLELVEIINENDLTIEDLTNRNGKLIIERVVGEVTNATEGDGKVLYGDPRYCYINYRCVDDISNGDIICTYFIYNPDTNYEDDTIARFDYVIDDKE